jgi:hypothetical protein
MICSSRQLSRVFLQITWKVKAVVSASVWAFNRNRSETVIFDVQHKWAVSPKFSKLNTSATDRTDDQNMEFPELSRENHFSDSAVKHWLDCRCHRFLIADLAISNAIMKIEEQWKHFVMSEYDGVSFRFGNPVSSCRKFTWLVSAYYVFCCVGSSHMCGRWRCRVLRDKVHSAWCESNVLIRNQKFRLCLALLCSGLSSTVSVRHLIIGQGLFCLLHECSRKAIIRHQHLSHRTMNLFGAKSSLKILS